MVNAKKNKSLTEGPIFSRLLLFVLPIIFTGVLQVVYNMADNIVVGQFSGDYAALGAVGSTASLTSLITNIMISLSAGAGVVISQLYGAKNGKDVSAAVHTSMAISVIGGLACMVLGLVFSRPLLSVMGTQDIYFEKAVLYMMIICIGIPATSVYNFGAAVLRSVGDSKTSLYILSVSGILNVVLNLFFVIVCDMSVDGVAIATVISQYASAVAVVFVLIKRKNECYSLKIKKLRIDGRIAKRIMKIGVPIALQSSLFSISNIVVTSAVNTFPPSVVDAKTIAFNIEAITYTVMNSFATAAMTFTGQNYGAEKYRRINKVLIYSVLQVIIAGILVSQIEIFFGRELASMYIDAKNPEKETITCAVLDIFSIMLTTYFLCGVMEVFSGVLKGLGFSISSMVVSLIGLAVRVLWILFVTPTEKFHTIFGLFVSYTISWLTTIVLLVVCCLWVWHKLGIWKRAKEERLTERAEKNAL